MSKEFFMASGWIFLILISLDYLLEITLNLLITREGLLKSIVIYLVLSLILGKLWLLFLLFLHWMLDSVLGVICLVILGITFLLVGPMLLLFVLW